MFVVQHILGVGEWDQREWQMSRGEIRDETRLMGGSSDLAGRLFRSKASPFRSD
jgi:hypothetical protein